MYLIGPFYRGKPGLPRPQAGPPRPAATVLAGFLLAVGALSGAGGCAQKPASEAVADATWAGAPPTTPGDGGALLPAAATVLRAWLRLPLADGGMAVLPLSTVDRLAIDPTASLELGTDRLLSNYRVRVFDEADRVVSSEDLPGQADGGTWYRITFFSPLTPQSRYSLVIDAELGTTFEDALGGTYTELRYDLETQGTRKPKAESRRKLTKKKRVRR